MPEVTPIQTAEGGAVEPGADTPGGGEHDLQVLLGQCFDVQTFYVRAPRSQSLYVSAPSLPVPII